MKRIFILLFCLFSSSYFFAQSKLCLMVPISNQNDDFDLFFDAIKEQSNFDEISFLLFVTDTLQETREKLDKYKDCDFFKVFFIENNLIAPHLNCALILNLAPYYMFLNANDRLQENKLEQLMNEFDQNDQLDFICEPINDAQRIIWRAHMHQEYGYFRQDLQESFLQEYFDRALSRGAIGQMADRCFSQQIEMREQKPIVVVIPSYNNIKWYKKNLDSVFNQKYENYRIIYIDDASTDGTGQAVAQYIKDCHQEDRVTLIMNKERSGAGANKYRGGQLCKKGEIYVDLDGDDWFAHKHVLDYLNQVYADPNVWVTYGQFIYSPFGAPGWADQLPQSVIDNNSVRQYDWRTTALRTFYADLFHRIRLQDLTYNNAFLPMASDLAFMFGIIEMAGKRSKFIPEILYIYNVTHLNDGIINNQAQHALGLYTRTKEPYKPLESLDENEHARTIYITPGLWGELFSINSPIYNRDDCLQPMFQLREQMRMMGYELQQANSLIGCTDGACVVSFDSPNARDVQEMMKYPYEKRILFLWEPPSVIPQNYEARYHQIFSKVFTWRDDLVDNKKYFKFHIPIWRPMIDDVVDFNEKQLCTMVACNKNSSHPNELYSERQKIVDFFEQNHPEDFALFGKGWDPSIYETYKGPIERKTDYIKDFKFCICYENIRDIPGYVTEKIFDAMIAGAVPIYWGACNIDAYVPHECFIDRRHFASNEELYEFIKNLSKEDYQEYIENICAFLKSQKAMLFSPAHFIFQMSQVLTGQMPKSNINRKTNESFNFCTAADSNYFAHLINLIGSIHKTNFDKLGTIAVFDLGMTDDQLHYLNTIEKVQVCAIEKTHPDLLTPFNTRHWGKPVPGWYAWKPVICKQALQMFDTVLCIDAGSTVLQPLDDLFDHINQNGYFLHNGSDWCINKECTEYVKFALQLHSTEKKWILDPSICGIEPGLMGLTKSVYNNFISPMYEYSKRIELFADDGTCPGGFGNSRHDLTLFSIQAVQNDLYIYHHFNKRPDDFYLHCSDGPKPFHIACTPQDRKESTAIYHSRHDLNLDYYMKYIRFK